MLSSDSPQGIYAPLSQVMTDSDSEEEIHNSSTHHQQERLRQAIRTSPPNNFDLNLQQHHHIQYQVDQHQQQKLDCHQYRERQLQQQKEQSVHQQQLYQKFQCSHTTESNLKQQQNSKQFQSHTISYTTNMQNTFRNVIMSDVNGDAVHHHAGSNFSSFNSDYDERHTDADNVAILGTGDAKDSDPMSTSRKCCFVVSLLVCFVTVVVFLAMPCTDVGICPAPLDRIKTHNWLNNYTKIELKGVINVVDGLRSWEKNLIFLYRGDAFFPEFERINTKRNGIISLIGSSGAVAWYDEMIDEPLTIDCTLVDVDRNGTPDCLVIDEYGELGAINPISGQWHWKFKEKSAHKIDALDFPVILPDLDGDGVLEILLATSMTQEQRNKNILRRSEQKNDFKSEIYGERNYLRILSGRVGQPIGDGYKIHDCDLIRKFQLEKTHMITFNCVRNNTEVQWSKTLAELFALITNKSIGQKLTPTTKISQHRHYGQRKETEAQRNIYSLSGRELIVENRGKCPDDCNVSFVLSEQKNGKVIVVRNLTNSAMYGMVPAQWHFKNSKSKMSGFVMKFWTWNSSTLVKNSTKLFPPSTVSNQSKSSNLRRQKREDFTKSSGKNQTPPFWTTAAKSDDPNYPTSEFNIFDHLVQKRHTYTIPGDVTRVERSIANITKQKSSSSSILLNKYKMQMITETVVLVIFIGADTRIENTSQSNIIQFCRNDRNEVICQPDLNNQENSLLIADLDQDGSQELVSYYSTFVNKEDDRKDWKLVTYVQLLRLESELPGFYANAKHN